MPQTVLKADGDYRVLDAWFTGNNVRSVLLVCDASIGFMKIDGYFRALPDRLPVRVVRFSGFQPNPLYENVVDGVKCFRDNGCDAIVAVGGGSAMDVAKCVKLYRGMTGDGADGAFLRQSAVADETPFLAVPTTAGTGSEATRFAVIYYQGAKQSVSDPACIPGTVLMDPGVLETLPLYHKKATMMDALCHAIESFWSVNSTEESMGYSADAIRRIFANVDAYLANEKEGNAGMLLAANVAGKAINITQTTAGHAMCYKITGLFGCAHGHAAALCDRVLFPWMLAHTDACVDPRGKSHLNRVFRGIAGAMGCATPAEAADRFARIFDRLELPVPAATEEQFAILRTSVNPDRLRNHPVALDEAAIDEIYHLVLNGEAK